MLERLTYTIVTLLILLFCASTLASTDTNKGGVIVIVNKSVEPSHLKSHELRSIFAMRKRSWPNGEAIQVFVLTDNDPTHELFAKKVLQTFPYNLRRIWDRRVYSGVGQSPSVVQSEKEMIEHISKTQDAIGYILSDNANDQVKIITLESL
ncbi:substrate-binding domain-containing protein [Marinibactrum halimedae]|uniref:PBP domain-containing protein n=1 Tax=Marinibactrum halimedae TaxID=1444977 RepID=A0AA37WLY1_9GAMM|nr:substrate-binding domain-containing protein [Marinibactrum halimedae]MCD9459617.1 substrate-binding domain-containing protein [Marinibactrum halimedae]GLS25565.1 hypothetical protein GCM10007877_12790 [Marinibactrum halimedae]